MRFIEANKRRFPLIIFEIKPTFALWWFQAQPPANRFVRDCSGLQVPCKGRIWTRIAHIACRAINSSTSRMGFAPTRRNSPQLWPQHQPPLHQPPCIYLSASKLGLRFWSRIEQPEMLSSFPPRLCIYHVEATTQYRSFWVGLY